MVPPAVHRTRCSRCQCDDLDGRRYIARFGEKFLYVFKAALTGRTPGQPPSPAARLRTASTARADGWHGDTRRTRRIPGIPTIGEPGPIDTGHRRLWTAGGLD